MEITTDNNEKLSPMHKQYNDLKEKHPDRLILFRCGDFYETYDTDAEDASKILGITLTRRFKEKGSDGHALKMAGFPYHAIDTYLPKLIRAGKRVAICDDIEDKSTKTTKRGITEVVNPEEETKSEETMTKEQEQAIRTEYEKQIEEIKSAAKAKDVEIATAVVKALGINIPSQLNDHISTAIGKLEFIKIKHRQKVKPYDSEMNYLIEMAEKAEKLN